MKYVCKTNPEGDILVPSKHGVGDILVFIVEGHTYECVVVRSRDDGCEGCLFEYTDKCPLSCRRPEGKDVIYKPLEELLEGL